MKLHQLFQPVDTHPSPTRPMHQLNNTQCKCNIYLSQAGHWFDSLIKLLQWFKKSKVPPLINNQSSCNLLTQLSLVLFVLMSNNLKEFFGLRVQVIHIYLISHQISKFFHKLNQCLSLTFLLLNNHHVATKEVKTQTKRLSKRYLQALLYLLAALNTNRATSTSLIFIRWQGGTTLIQLHSCMK